jgi:hypothetical protein
LEALPNLINARAPTEKMREEKRWQIDDSRQREKYDVAAQRRCAAFFFKLGETRRMRRFRKGVSSYSPKRSLCHNLSEVNHVVVVSRNKEIVLPQ